VPGFGHIVQLCAHNELRPKNDVQKNLTNQIITNFPETAFLERSLLRHKKNTKTECSDCAKFDFIQMTRRSIFDSLFYDDYILF